MSGLPVTRHRDASTTPETAWTEERVRAFIETTRFRRYQRIDLPYGLSTPGKDRGETARAIFASPPAGKRVLDIGCDYGYFCHEAVRLGATAATGLEMDPSRFSVARTISEIKGGNVTIRLGTIEDASLEEPFEWVLALNVLHHFADPFAALRRAAALATERVIVEFPKPSDRRFLRRSKLSRLFRRRYDEKPFIGVGTRRGHGTYYFSPRAFELAFVTHLRLFREVAFAPSPSFPDRCLAFCER